MTSEKNRRESHGFDPSDPFYSVSVVIPVYNGEKFIQQTLDSILSQTIKAHEVIVVDDESPDESMKIVSRFGNRVSVIRTTNGGAVAARNLGASKAKGTWLAFCDQDDLWHPTKLERQLRLVSECPDIHFVMTDYSDIVDGVPADRSHLSYAPKDFWTKEEHGAGFVVRESVTAKLSVFQPSITSVPIVRREFFEKTGGFDPEVEWGAEDTCFHFRCLSAVPFGVVPEVLMYYNRHPYAKSADTIEQVRRTIAVWEHIIARYPQAQPYQAELLHGLKAMREEIKEAEQYAKRQRLKRAIGIR
jgi:glycosyltransferase involved in cell wall biosynthesis